MTSIRKAKKWYKSCINSKNEYEKKLGTIRKCPAWHRYYYATSYFQKDVLYVHNTDKVKKKQKKQSLVLCFFLVFTFSFLGYSLSDPRAFVAS